MAYDQALAAARHAEGTSAGSAKAVETSDTEKSAEPEPAEPQAAEAKPAPEPVTSPAAAAAASAAPTDEPAAPVPPAEDQLVPDGEPPVPAGDQAVPDHEPPAFDDVQPPPADEPTPPTHEQPAPAEAPVTPTVPATAFRPAATPRRRGPIPAATTTETRTPLELWLGRQPEIIDEDAARHRRHRRLLIITLAAVLALGACTVGGAWLLSERFAGQVQRIPRVFDQIPEQERPDKPQEGPAAEAQNFLLAGTDRRSDQATTGEEAAAPAWVPGAQRSDTIILVHLTADRKKAYVISFPRDSWVEIPDHGMNKINAAFSLGGPTLYVRTMEQLTGIRIDHLAIIDWDGFIGLTNALGGVDVTIPRTTRDSHNDRTWEAGTYHLYGEDALDYVRQRYGLPRGDFDRVQRQQNFLREIMRKTLDSGTLSNPLRLARVLDAVTRTVSVDDTMSNADLRGLALSLRGIRQGNVVFMTAPNVGTGWEGNASVVYLDQRRAQRLYDAIKKDDVDSYLAKYGKPDEQLGTAPA